MFLLVAPMDNLAAHTLLDQIFLLKHELRKINEDIICKKAEYEKEIDMMNQRLEQKKNNSRI